MVVRREGKNAVLVVATDSQKARLYALINRSLEKPRYQAIRLRLLQELDASAVPCFISMPAGKVDYINWIHRPWFPFSMAFDVWVAAQAWWWSSPP